MFEFAIILLLVLVNGLLAGAEMAIVTARRGRLEALAADGSRGARAALALRSEPERFLASVQVGITAIGALAGAFGGSQLSARLTPFLEEIGLGSAAPEIAFVLVVVLVTYLSVVFGELVPKSLALRFGERAAVFAALPMRLVSRIARPVVTLLTASSNLVLRGFGDRTDFMEGRITRDDLEQMVRDAGSGGELDAPTTTLLARALEFTELRITEVMVHRRDVFALPLDTSFARLRDCLLGTGHRRIPVYDGTIDHIVGYVLRDDVLADLCSGTTIELRSVVREPYFVPEQMRAERALRELQQRKIHLAIVVEETGGIAGIVTLEDLLEELVGEIFHERDAPQPQRITAEGEGVWRVLGGTDLRELEQRIGLQIPEDSSARTIGGLCVELAETHIPAAGARFTLEDRSELEVLDATPRRVRSVRIRAGQEREPEPER